MKRIIIYAGLVLAFFCSCREENVPAGADATIVFDTITCYSNDSIRVGFHIDFTPVTSEFKVEWISPPYFVQDSSYGFSLESDFIFEFVLKDSSGVKIKNITRELQFDSLYQNPAYDFRNQYGGNYLFSVNISAWRMREGELFDSTYEVYGFVKKTGDLHSSLLEINFGDDTLMHTLGKVLTENSAYRVSPDNKLSYDIWQGGNTYVYGNFITCDSLELHISYGGQGGFTRREIRARKISPAAAYP